MRIILFLLIHLYAVSAFSQYSSVELTEESAKKIGELSKKSILYVVISNEKDPFDAALLSAVKNNWKIGTYKLLAKTAFLNSKSKNELSANDLYLYESNENEQFVGNSSAVVLANVLSKNRTGVFYLSEGSPKDIAKKNQEPVRIKFDMSSTLTNTKEKVIEGYFDLMIKYFNNELLFCQKPQGFKDVKKEDKDGIVYFDKGLNDVQTKNILLVKEQVNKNIIADKASNKKTTPYNAVSQFNPPGKNIYTVFPEDIKLALTKADKDVLIYSNDMLINAGNGAVVAGPSNFGAPQIKKDGFVLAALGILLSSFLIATLIK
jgi:hypothetical protein